MKQCPQCGTRNQRTNLFCPMCGNSFIPEPGKDGREKKDQQRRAKPRKGERKRRTLLVVIVVAVLVLAAGFTSFLISREIVRGQDVVVKSGSQWRCTQCGKVYEKRVLKLVVPRRDSDRYSVETFAGKCYTCQYGAFTGQFQDFFAKLSEQDFFHGYTVEMRQAAAEFISQHPDLLPATSEGLVSPLGQQIDPAELAGAIDQYAGKTVVFEGKLLYTQVMGSGSIPKMTYLQFAPLSNGKEVPTTFHVFYPGATDLVKGDTAYVYVLPVDVVRYSSGVQARTELVGIALFVKKI